MINRLLLLAALCAGLPLQAYSAGTDNRITVAPGETLWRIATRVRPDDQVAVVQVVYALWHANSSLFQAQSVHRLQGGSTLQIPTRAYMLQTPESDARRWYYTALTQPGIPQPTAQPLMPMAAPVGTVPDQPTLSTATPSVAATPAVMTVATSPADSPAPEPQQQTTPWYRDINADYSLQWQQRYYPQQGEPRQAQHYSSAAFSADWYWQSADRRHQLALQPYLRWDQRDNERNLLDLRQAYWQYVGDGFDIKAGVDIVFWGVTESQHLVDVINQTDAVASVDGETKLGQPMLNWNLHGSAGSLGLYLLPYFRERSFAGPNGRLRPPLYIDQSQPQYESAQAERNLDFALRWSRRFAALELGLSYFEGNNREALLQPTAQNTLQPVYLQMQQLGLDSLWLSGSWIWKLESIYRKTRQQDFVAATAGFEYTHVGLFGSNWDLGWIAEYQYDSRDQQAPVPGQNDIFVGGRLVVNDIGGTEILLGIAQDLDNSSSQSGKLEASTRLGNRSRLSLDAWFFRSDPGTDPLYLIRRDDFLQLSLDYYF